MMTPRHPRYRRPSCRRLLRLALLPTLAVLALANPASAQEEPAHGADCADMRPPKAGLEVELGGFHRAITTASAEAQAYFDQGLYQLFARRFEEAVRSFGSAVAADPGCAPCYWGRALALGPGAGRTADQERLPAAHQALASALVLTDGASPVEAALIAALDERIPSVPSADPAVAAELGRRYAAAMEQVARSFPGDADVQVLLAEALLAVPGEEAGAGEAIARALDLAPGHPGAEALRDLAASRTTAAP